MISVYLAGPWVKREDVRWARVQLQNAGIQVNAQWLDVPDLPGAGQTTETQEHLYDLRAEAERDIDDIYASAAMVVINLEKSEGKSVETGIALEMGMPVIVVGKRSNVFHYLPEVMVVETVAEAITALKAFHAFGMDHSEEVEVGS